MGVSFIIVVFYLVTFLQKRRKKYNAKVKKVIKTSALDINDYLLTKIYDHATNKALKLLTPLLKESFRSTKELSKNKQKMNLDLIIEILKSIKALFEEYIIKKKSKNSFTFTFFKVTLFRLNIIEGKKYLHRVAYAYPTGIEPTMTSENMNIDKYKSSTASLSVRNKKIIMIEDIDKELLKSYPNRRWVELYPGSVKTVNSIICIPIFSIRKDSPQKKVIGLLTMATNIENYFREDSQHQTFIVTLLNPFIILLAGIMDRTY